MTSGTQDHKELLTAHRIVRPGHHRASLPANIPSISEIQRNVNTDLFYKFIGFFMYERWASRSCGRRRGLGTLLEQLRAEALAADPNLVDDRRSGHRYNAACAAALAGAGQGNDVPPPDAAARTKLRQQSRDWLKPELLSWTKLLESGNLQAGPAIVRTLTHWKEDSELAGIRDVDALAKLPSDEQKEWRTFWDEVDLLLERAAMSRAKETKPEGTKRGR
jgi:hypothetical protein